MVNLGNSARSNTFVLIFVEDCMRFIVYSLLDFLILAVSFTEREAKLFGNVKLMLCLRR